MSAAVADRLVVRVCDGCGEPMQGSGHHAHGGRLSPHRDEEVVSLSANEREVEDAAWRAVQIYVRSIAEAETSLPEYIESGGMDRSFLGGRDNRAQIIANFAADWGVDFSQVRCTRRWMRVDVSLIAERAAEFAARPEDYGEEPVAYTWEDEGWAWEDCEQGDPRAVGFYHCEEKS